MAGPIRSKAYLVLEKRSSARDSIEIRWLSVCTVLSLPVGSSDFSDGISLTSTLITEERLDDLDEAREKEDSLCGLTDLINSDALGGSSTTELMWHV